MAWVFWNADAVAPTSSKSLKDSVISCTSPFRSDSAAGPPFAPQKQHWVGVRGSQPHGRGNGLLGATDTQLGTAASQSPAPALAPDACRRALSPPSHRGAGSSAGQLRGFGTKASGSSLRIHGRGAWTGGAPCELWPAGKLPGGCPGPGQGHNPPCLGHSHLCVTGLPCFLFLFPK